LYDELWLSIHSLMRSAWQSISVIVGALAMFALVEKQIVNIDIATSIFVAICFWSLACIIDAAFWYNRNLAIVANVEKDFLLESDLVNIHPYFNEHRKDNEMIAQFRIQFLLVVVVLSIFLAFHFFNRVVTGFCLPLSNFDFLKAIPYILTLVVGLILYKFWRYRIKEYNEFTAKAPGKTI